MTFDKMLRILNLLAGVNGHVGVSSGSEIMLSPTSQLQKPQHRRLLYLGFVYVGTDYIYRPKIRS